MATSIKLFESESFGQIRCAGTSDEPLFCLSDVCRVLDIKNVSDCKNRLDKEGVVLTDTPTTNQYGAEVIQKMIYVNEKNLYKVIMRSDKPIAEKFQDWICGDVIPTIRKTGTYKIIDEPKKQTLTEQMKAANWAAKFLNLNESAKMIIAKQILAPFNFQLPDYVNSKGILKSATELLKERKTLISVREFNIMAIDKGLLCEMERKSKSQIKKFKSITKKGLQFGENVVCPNNPRSTQPLWYMDKFDELLSVLGYQFERALL